MHAATAVSHTYYNTSYDAAVLGDRVAHCDTNAE